MKNNTFCQSILAAAIAASVGIPSTLAAVQESESSAMLEELVITASRNQQRIFDSPASLSIINEETLNRATVPTLAEMMRDVPGVQVTDSGQPGLARVRVRGEESRRTSILINSQESTDHHEVGTPLTLHPAMVERIEVIRGSGAVLYGSRALSGVVNFLTKKGGSEPLQGTVSAGYDGATSGHDVFASLFGNINGFEYRLAYTEGDHDERSTPEGDMEDTAFDNESLYLYAGKTFDNHRLEYIYEKFESSSEIFVEEEIKTTYPLTDFYLDAPQRDREKHGVYYHWDVENSWLSSLQANAYQQQNDRHFYTFTETVWYQRDIDTWGDLTTDGALAQLNFQPLGDHQIIAGIQYLKDEVDQDRRVDTLSWVPPIAPTGIETINDQAEIETWAWFAQDQWEVNDRLSLTAGLRQYFVEADLNYSDRESLSPGSLGDDDEVIGALGLVWDQNDNVRLRANISEGYVYPSLMQLATGAYAGSSFVNPDPDLDPETSINYELGMRMQSGNLVMDATAFYTESEDYIHHQVCTPEDNCPGRRDRTYLNIGESQAHGIELFLSYSNGPLGIEPYTNLTWMERENDYAEFSTTKTGIPSLSGRAGLRWEGQLWSIPALWSDFYLRGETGSKLEEPGTVRSVLEDKKGWVTVNVATGMDFGPDRAYQLSLELLNLGDKSYIASTENLYGVERTVAAKFSFNW